MFTRSIALSLGQRPDRSRAFAKRVRYLNSTRPGILNAIDGTLCPPPSWWNRSDGAWGQYITHVMAIQRALNDRIQSILIFEDDAVFAKDYDGRLCELMECVPSDWHMLYLGGRYVDTAPPTTLNPLVYRCKQVLGTYAYAVSLPGMELLYPYLWQDSHANPKLCIGELYASLMQELGLRVYAPKKWLVGHGPGVSDVNRVDHKTVEWNHFQPDS